MAGVGDVPLYDQRGFAFQRVEGGRIDIGAVEYGAVSANFDANDVIDGFDFLAWQRGFGTTSPNAVHAHGDADIDGDVDGNDLAIWENQFGDSASPLLAAATSNQSAPAQAETISVPQTVQPITHAELVDAAMAMELLSTSSVGDEVIVGQEQLSGETLFYPTFASNDPAPSSGVPSFHASRATSLAEPNKTEQEWSNEDAVDEVLERAFG